MFMWHSIKLSNSVCGWALRSSSQIEEGALKWQELFHKCRMKKQVSCDKFRVKVSSVPDLVVELYVLGASCPGRTVCPCFTALQILGRLLNQLQILLISIEAKHWYLTFAQVVPDVIFLKTQNCGKCTFIATWPPCHGRCRHFPQQSISLPNMDLDLCPKPNNAY